MAGDRFIGEAEPPFGRFFNIAPGPKYKERSVRNLARKAKELGFQLVAVAEAA